MLADYYKLYTVSKLLQKNKLSLKQNDEFKFVYKKHKCLETKPKSIEKRRTLIQSKVNGLRDETWIVGATTVFEETAWLKKKYEAKYARQIQAFDELVYGKDKAKKGQAKFKELLFGQEDETFKGHEAELESTKEKILEYDALMNEYAMNEKQR